MIGWQEIIDISSFILVASGVIYGLLEYRRSIIVKRAEWLYRLFNDFYMRDSLKEIRKQLDSVEGRNKIKEAVKKELDDRELNEDEDNLLENLIDYLNFFEFMIYLKKIGALEVSDVDNMFNYYIMLLKDDQIENYLKKNGFENLKEYLNEMSYMRR